MFFLLALGALFIISTNNLHLNTTSDLKTFSDVYANWLDEVFDNIKNTTGYAINLKWGP